MVLRKTDFLLNNLIAHRGWYDGQIPENSMPAFAKAVANGYLIELDVCLTKDQKVVVFHDENLQRMCNINKLVEECNYAELLKYNLLNSNYKIPLLSEVLTLVNQKVGLLIEIKSLKFNGVLEKETAKLLDKYQGDFAIQSFNILTLKWFKKHRNNYLRGLLASDFKNKKINKLKKQFGKSLIADIILKTDFISYDLRALPNSFVKNKRKTKPILAWTIRNGNDYEKAQKYADNFICENKILAKKKK